MTGMKLRHLLLSAGLLLGACASVTAQETAKDCDETCLYQIAGTFMDNMVDQYPQGAPLADTIRMTENGVDVESTGGIWTETLGWSYRHTFVDEIQGGIGIFGVVRLKDEADAIIALRLKVEDQEITESEGLVVRKGEFALFETGMTRARPLWYQYVPEERRNTREELAEIAENYFWGLANGDPSRLKFHPDCNRQENGFQTTNNPPRINRSCADLYPFVYMHSYRKPEIPVIDTERGLVLGITAFDMIDQTKTLTIRGKPFHITTESRSLPRTLFLYELFKVDNGQVMVIDAFLMNQPFGTKMGWDER